MTCILQCELLLQVGLTEEQAKEDAAKKGYELGKSVGHFRANSKALAEGEGDGIAKVSETIVLIQRHTDSVYERHGLGRG
jgi:pyruvate/2-oxoglutarate dehydrogenase complex dihydrolipoamide dehydrogenase (E3) component